MMFVRALCCWLATATATWAALPVILVDSATGSDSAASGAGPSTALTGSSASTNGAGTVVTLDGSPDLTNVATDGSHVIYLADATAGARNFGKITDKDNTAKTVTVANAFGVSLSGKSWAIGGKRASVCGTASKKLIENNSAAGDAMPGWVIEMKSGHSETGLSATLTFRRAGDTTDGAIILRGEAGAATLPLLRWSSDVTHVTVNVDNIQLRDFQIDTSASGTTNNIAVQLATSTSNCVLKGLKIGGTNAFRRGIYIGNAATRVTIRDNEIINASLTGIEVQSNVAGLQIANNYIRSGCSTAGIYLGDGTGVLVAGNLVNGVTGDGIYYAPQSSFRQFFVSHNTVYNCSGDGIENAATLANNGGVWLANNICANNGGYGIKFSGSGVTAALLAGTGATIEGNDTYNNTSGQYSPSGIGSGDPGLDPQFANAGSHNFAIGTNLKGQGYPLGGTLKIGKYSATNSYVDPGAAQRQESGGGVPVDPIDGGPVH